MFKCWITSSTLIILFFWLKHLDYAVCVWVSVFSILLKKYFRFFLSLNLYKDIFRVHNYFHIFSYLTDRYRINTFLILVMFSFYFIYNTYFELPSCFSWKIFKITCNISHEHFQYGPKLCFLKVKYCNLQLLLMLCSSK